MSFTGVVLTGGGSGVSTRRELCKSQSSSSSLESSDDGGAAVIILLWTLWELWTFWNCKFEIGISYNGPTGNWLGPFWTCTVFGKSIFVRTGPLGDLFWKTNFVWTGTFWGVLLPGVMTLVRTGSIWPIVGVLTRVGISSFWLIQVPALGVSALVRTRLFCTLYVFDGNAKGFVWICCTVTTLVAAING